MSETRPAYEALTKSLAERKYTFICPSPETAARLVEKRNSSSSTKYAKNAEDFFGWSLPATRQSLAQFVPDVVFESLHKAAVLVPTDENDTWRSTIRVSNFYLPNLPTNATDANLYYIHSSFPASSDSVFFGPDTYLFTSFLRSATRHLQQSPNSIIDVCCGSGAGAIHMARTYPKANTLGLDLNPRALRLGGVNAQLAGTNVEYYESNLYAKCPDKLRTSGIDLIVSNPPYIASSADGKDLPIYADGGAEFGLDISIRIVEQGMEILSSNGFMMLYTGVAIPNAKPGYDALLDKLQKVQNVEIVEYTILHPDMWSEEIGKGAYADVGRIQVVGAVLRRA